MRGLTRYIINPKHLSTINNCYEVYKKLCVDFAEKPKSLSSFKNFITILDKENLINTEIKNFGKSGGLATICYPSMPVDIIKPLVLQSIRMWLK